MVVQFICDLIKTLILFVVDLFPTLPDMATLSSPVTAVVDVLLAINSFVSVRLVGVSLVLLFIFTNIEFIWSIVMWVVRRIPGQG